jgi:hypothetical protein
MIAASASSARGGDGRTAGVAPSRSAARGRRHARVDPAPVAPLDGRGARVRRAAGRGLARSHGAQLRGLRRLTVVTARATRASRGRASRHRRAGRVVSARSRKAPRAAAGVRGLRVPAGRGRRGSWIGFGRRAFLAAAVTYVASGDGAGWGSRGATGEPLHAWDAAVERLVCWPPRSIRRRPSAPRGRERGPRSRPPDADCSGASSRLRRHDGGTRQGRGRSSRPAPRRTRLDASAVLARLLTRTRADRLRVPPGWRCFLGATPERLIARAGLAVMAEALAGSAARDGARARRRSAQREGLTSTASSCATLADRLRPLCASLDVPRVPVLRAAGEVVHLRTPIEGQLARSWHVLRLVERLHPTPAVGGPPNATALAWIERNEPSPRGGTRRRWAGSRVGRR